MLQVQLMNQVLRAPQAAWTDQACLIHRTMLCLSIRCAGVLSLCSAKRLHLKYDTYFVATWIVMHACNFHTNCFHACMQGNNPGQSETLCNEPFTHLSYVCPIKSRHKTYIICVAKAPTNFPICCNSSGFELLLRITCKRHSRCMETHARGSE